MPPISTPIRSPTRTLIRNFPFPFPFPKFPSEIRLRIYELANQPQLEPRCVEIDIHPTTGTLYSKTAPPPLLHVNSESRQVVLRIYKPWLPQFRGSAAHAPYATLAELYPPETISRLQNICVHLEYDTLFMRLGADHLSASLLGPVEQLHLRQIAMESNPKMPPPFFFCYTIFPGALTEPLVMTSTKHVQLLSQLRDLRAIKVCYSGHDEASHQEREFLLRLYPCSRALAEYEWKVLDPSTSTVESRDFLTLEHLKLEELLPPPPKYAQPWTSYKNSFVGTCAIPRATELQVSSNTKLPLPWRNQPVESTMYDTDGGEIESGRTFKASQKQPRLTMRGGVSSPCIFHDNPATLPSSSSGVYQPPEEAFSSFDSMETTEEEIFAQLNGEAAMSMPTPAGRSKRTAESNGNEESDFNSRSPSDFQENTALEDAIRLFRAERITPEGLQILVEWKGFSLKKDWTWEAEESLTRSVPRLVSAWHSRYTSNIQAIKKHEKYRDSIEVEGNDDDEEGEVEVYEVKRIIDRRNIKGVLHYLVEWKGFPLMDDRTWEPSDVLKCDVPLIVEDYENGRRRQRRR